MVKLLCILSSNNLSIYNLKSLSELPPLAAPRDLDAIGAELERRAASLDSATSTESPDG